MSAGRSHQGRLPGGGGTAKEKYSEVPPCRHTYRMTSPPHPHTSFLALVIPPFQICREVFIAPSTVPGTPNKWGLNSFEFQSIKRGKRKRDERGTSGFPEMGATAGRGSFPGRPADGKQLAEGVCDSPHSHRLVDAAVRLRQESKA